MIMKLDKHTGSLAIWAERTGGILADGGSPLRLHKGRFRPTHANMLARRGWTGRTTIDPNHSAAVEDDHYLVATTPPRSTRSRHSSSRGRAISCVSPCRRPCSRASRPSSWSSDSRT
ncbi:hypothetical protein [Streptosporangium sp. CA-115845]|uniref:hypothetical protein n=1 Tax=Streptosporangium sp. CA-115845 TaxID=3240071 RepID=UPI003D8BAD36